MQRRVVSMYDRLVSLTDGATFHILPHKFFAARPPILLKQQLMSLVDPWMCRCRGIMIYVKAAAGLG